MSDIGYSSFSIQGGVLVSDDAVGYFERNRIFDNRVTGVEIKNDGNPVFIDNEIYGAQASGVIVYRQGKRAINQSNNNDNNTSNNNNNNNNNNKTTSKQWVVTSS